MIFILITIFRNYRRLAAVVLENGTTQTPTKQKNELSTLSQGNRAMVTPKVGD